MASSISIIILEVESEGAIGGESTKFSLHFVQTSLARGTISSVSDGDRFITSCERGYYVLICSCIWLIGDVAT